MKESKITFRLSEADKTKLMRIAADKDIPVSQLIREAIKTFLKEFTE